ncbi:N-acetyltransferase family protein [Chryseobacterium sp. A301]
MLNLRDAKKEDSTLIFELIKKLAQYEKMENDVSTSPEELEKQLFDFTYAHVIIVEENQIAIGFALYFFNFSTFVGKPGLYLEDLYIEPQHRNKGYGKKVLKELAQRAKNKGCGRMEWSVLKWNSPSIAFYKSLGASAMEEWDVYRLTESQIEDLAKI